jgi:predicted signal transduction protein with EAL and GGDEF domain
MQNSFEHLLKISDAALYAAKDAGHDRAVIGSAHQESTGGQRHETEHHATPSLHMIANGQLPLRDSCGP